MANRAIAEEKRTLVFIADEDSDVPEALRRIAKELEEGEGELVRLDVIAGRLDGTEQLPEPERDEDGNEVAPPASSGMAPKRLDIRIEAEIRNELTQED